MRFFTIAIATFAVAIIVHGCTPPEPLGPRQAIDWEYTPTSIDVHPLSRFRVSKTPNEETTIVVHIELHDGDGFACRGVGQLRVNITTSQDELLASKLVDLADPDINRESFDDVTRTYQVRFNHLPANCKRVNIEAIFPAEHSDPYKSNLFTIVKRVNK